MPLRATTGICASAWAPNGTSPLDGTCLGTKSRRVRQAPRVNAHLSKLVLSPKNIYRHCSVSSGQRVDFVNPRDARMRSRPNWSPRSDCRIRVVPALYSRTEPGARASRRRGGDDARFAGAGPSSPPPHRPALLPDAIDEQAAAVRTGAGVSVKLHPRSSLETGRLAAPSLQADD